MKKRSKTINLLMYKVYLGFMAMICLISTPNKSDQKSDGFSNFIPSKNNVMIIDERNGLEPNVEGVDSYKIVSPAKMLEIIDEIISYNQINPSENWDRNKYVMLVEWMIHNMAYYMGFFTSSSVSVDFSTFEENFYSLGLNKD